jgi:REP element-mobilizing transposase RayT
VCKLVKGYVGRKFFQVFPELKQPKQKGGLFWSSGLFSPATFGGTPENEERIVRYIQNQRYGLKSSTGKQARLTAYT